MKKDIGLILFLVLAIVLTMVLYKQDYAVSKESVYGGAIDSAARSLRLERQDLEQRKAQLQKELDSKAAGKGVNILLITELKEEIVTEVYPTLKERSFPAVLAFSPEQHPGAEGCLTEKEYRSLKKAGWTSCLYWDGRGELEDYLAETDGLFEAVGEKRPQVVYFQSGQYKRDFDEDLLANGFTIVINHGEEETPIIQRGDEQELWRINSVAWNRAGIRNYVKKVAELGGVFSMHMDFGKQRSGYISEIFYNMCAYMNLLENQTVMDPVSAREYRKTLVIDPSLSAEIEWCQKEIDQINQEIRAIYENN